MTPLDKDDAHIDPVNSGFVTRKKLLTSLHECRADDICASVSLLCGKLLPLDGELEKYFADTGENFEEFKARYINTDLLDSISLLKRLKEKYPEIVTPETEGAHPSFIDFFGTTEEQFDKAFDEIQLPFTHPGDPWVGNDGNNLTRFDCEMENDLARIRAEALIIRGLEIDVKTFMKEAIQEALIYLFSLWDMRVPHQYLDGLAPERIAEIVENSTASPLSEVVMASTRQEKPERDTEVVELARRSLHKIAEREEKGKTELIALSEDKELGNLDSLTEMILGDIDSIQHVESYDDDDEF